MAIKLSNQALEPFSFPLAETARNLYQEIEKLSLPKEILKEIIKFSERNLMIFKVNHQKIVYECCPNCLKAHIIKKAKYHGLSQEVINKIKSLLKSEIGHNGYYMDENKVIRIAP